MYNLLILNIKLVFVFAKLVIKTKLMRNGGVFIPCATSAVAFCGKTMTKLNARRFFLSPKCK